MRIDKIKEYFKSISIKNMVFNNFWLKLIALGIAIITWFYVNGELTKGIRV